MGVFSRAFEIVKTATEQRDIPVAPFDDNEWSSAFTLYDMACKKVCETLSAHTGNPISEGEVMGPEYRRRVEKQLENMQRLAFDSWRPSGEGAAYVKDFPSVEARLLAQDVLALVDVGGNILQARSHDEQYPPNERLGYTVSDFEQQDRAQKQARRLSRRKDELDLLAKYEGISLSGAERTA